MGNTGRQALEKARSRRKADAKQAKETRANRRAPAKANGPGSDDQLHCCTCIDSTRELLRTSAD